MVIWAFTFFLALVPVCFSVDSYLKKEYSLMKPYSMDYWDFGGSTIVTPHQVRLTPDEKSRKGIIWNKLLNHMMAWEVHVGFRVHGKGNELFGDGFAFWYSKNRMQFGNVFGGPDYHNGLGIFLDTYDNQNSPHNHAHPYISAMVNNGSVKYDHDRDGTHTELAGCEAQFRGVSNDAFIAIRYIDNTLTVSIDIDGSDKWKSCFSVKGVVLPLGYYFGASAATGDLSDNHDILSFKVYQLDVEKSAGDETDYYSLVPSAENFAAPRDHVTEDDDSDDDSSKDTRSSDNSSGEGGSGFLFALKVFAYTLFITLFLAVIAYFIYTNYFSSQRKRFY